MEVRLIVKRVFPIIAALVLSATTGAFAQATQPVPAQLPQPVPQQPVTQPAVPDGQQPYEATLVSASGTTAQVQFADGSTKSYTVDANTATMLSSAKGKHVAFRVLKGNMQLAKDVKWATVTAVKDGTATVKDASNNVATVPVSADVQSKLQASIGQLVGYAVIGNTMVLTVDSAPPN